MARRSRSSHQWLAEHFSDPFVKRAHAEGWRSRAVFKLEEVDKRERLLRPGLTVLDLGAAPGAWSQYARKRIGAKGRLIASDILPMDALAGVEFLQADFREPEAALQLAELAGGKGIDLVLSDMAPNMSGVDVVDQAKCMYLAELAMELALQLLKPGGNALIKVFQGVGFQEFVAAARRPFTKVRLYKPAASRARSPESYLLASGRRMV
jgi:23S rRNA (uridine2552-2'-O)-methyltransferase